MSDLTEYILAKQILAQRHVPVFTDCRMDTAEIMDADRIYSRRGGPFALVDLDASASVVIPFAVRSTPAQSCLNLVQALLGVFPVSGTMSDSQPCSQRDQRAQDIRAVNMQAQVPLARVYDFEKPFPEERSYNPRIPETPKILKLRK